MDESQKREFWRNIMVGAVVTILTIVLALWLAKTVTLNYDQESGMASRLVLAFGTFILIIYAILMSLAKFVVYLSRSHPDNSVSQSAQSILGHWVKWLIVLFIFFALALLYAVEKSGLM
jgi:L-asparagine transporter-like permease